jgi:hypothetical protein
MRMMRALRIPAKMGLMGLFLMVPLVLLLTSAVRSTQADINFAVSEIQGARLAHQISALVAQVQVHRGLTNRALNSDPKAALALPSARAAFVEAHRALDAGIAQTRAFDVTDLWRERSPALQALAAGQHAAASQQAFAEHSVAIESLRALLLLVAERSGLLLDPQATTFFLMDIGIERLLPLAESMGVARGQGSASWPAATSAAPNARNYSVAWTRCNAN